MPLCVPHVLITCVQTLTSLLQVELEFGYARLLCARCTFTVNGRGAGPVTVPPLPLIVALHAAD